MLSASQLDVASCAQPCVLTANKQKQRELWGNFPHAITTTAIIYTALRLSIPWRNMI
jgi:hypothetical protein